MDGSFQRDARLEKNEIAKAQAQVISQVGGESSFATLFLGLGSYKSEEVGEEYVAKAEVAMQVTNAIAKAFRENPRAKSFATAFELIREGKLPSDAIAKSALDVGYITNFANVVGGQTLSYVSLDTNLARGTVRPNSFTLYQCLRKSAAYQMVDYWGYAAATGGGLPGTAFMSTQTAGSGTLNPVAGTYDLQNVVLKLAVDTRAITIALAASNNYVDIGGQETINASLNILETVNWACYWGNATNFPNQFNGIASLIPTANVFDAYAFYLAQATQNGWSVAQSMFNLIYQASAQITSYRNFGRITHAFMTPTTAGALQGLVTTLLNNVVTMAGPQGIIVNGDLQGMKTRFGDISFPIDLYINARDKPAQAILIETTGTNMASSGVTPVTSVAATVSGTTAGSNWTTNFVATSGVYSYAVAALDSSMNESTLTYLTGNSVSGIAVGGANYLTITPATANAQAYRVYRSGLGYSPASSAVANPGSYRAIGIALASGASAVVFADLNNVIPGAENVFLLDLDDNDMALDFRFLLPLSRINLFAQALYQPWAVAMIGAVRMRIPKFHGLIRNFIPDNPDFNPFAANPNAT